MASDEFEQALRENGWTTLHVMTRCRMCRLFIEWQQDGLVSPGGASYYHMHCVGKSALALKTWKRWLRDKKV